MKRIHAPLALVVFLILATTSGHASRARVEAAGSMEFLFEDDSATLTPFRVGNPAGLALVPRIDLFDLSLQWRIEEFNYSFGTAEYRTLRRTTSTRPATKSEESTLYDGLTVFPVANLALQVGGTLSRQKDAYDFTAQLAEPQRRLGFVRTAYDGGLVQVGIEGGLNGSVENHASGLLAPGLIRESGKTTTQTNTVTGGFLFRLPTRPDTDQWRLNFGGIYSLMPLSPRREDENTIWVESSALRIQVRDLYRIRGYKAFGPDLFLEIPGRLQAGLFARKTSVEGTMEQTSDQASLLGNTPAHKVSDQAGLFGGMGFKFAHPVSDFTDLRGGLFLSISNAEGDSFGPDGAKTSRSETDEVDLSLGIGIASEGDYSAGFQYVLRTEGGHEGLAPSRLERDVAEQNFTLGGEDWFTERWAYRIGITSQLIENKGGTLYQADYFSTEAGSRVLSTLLTAGLGHQRQRLLADMKVHAGQASYLTGDTGRFATLVGILLTATLLF